MPELDYVVTVSYHEYSFNNVADALTFAKLAICGGSKYAEIQITRKETAEDEETAEETEA